MVPAPHAMKGEVPVAYVVARDPGAPPDEEAVKRFFLERGAPYAHPRRVFFLDRLPLGGTGKLDRTALKRQAAAAAAHRVAAMSAHLRVDKSPFHRLLGLELVRAEDGDVEMRLPWRDELGRADGSDWFHGGVISALIDIAGDYAVASKLGRGVPTIDLRVDYLRPARRGELRAVARAVKVGPHASAWPTWSCATPTERWWPSAAAPTPPSTPASSAPRVADARSPDPPRRRETVPARGRERSSTYPRSLATNPLIALGSVPGTKAPRATERSCRTRESVGALR